MQPTPNTWAHYSILILHSVSHKSTYVANCEMSVSVDKWIKDWKLKLKRKLFVHV